MNPVLDSVISSLNAQSTVAARLVLTGNMTSQLDNADYTITVTVTTFLGQSSTARLTFTKKPSGAAPMVSIVGGSQQSFKIAQGINVGSVLDPTSVCAGKAVSVFVGYCFRAFCMLQPQAAIKHGLPCICLSIAQYVQCLALSLQ